MKTNEASPASVDWTNAPDKVYLSSCMRSDFIKAVTSGHAGDIEYIRKDLLLEWAKETYLGEKASAIRKVCFKQLVDKLESM